MHKITIKSSKTHSSNNSSSCKLNWCEATRASCFKNINQKTILMPTKDYHLCRELKQQNLLIKRCLPRMSFSSSDCPAVTNFFCFITCTSNKLIACWVNQENNCNAGIEIQIVQWSTAEITFWRNFSIV
jgi:hypothetical protein